MIILSGIFFVIKFLAIALYLSVIWILLPVVIAGIAVRILFLSENLEQRDKK